MGANPDDTTVLLWVEDGLLRDPSLRVLYVALRGMSEEVIRAEERSCDVVAGREEEAEDDCILREGMWVAGREDVGGVGVVVVVVVGLLLLT